MPKQVAVVMSLNKPFDRQVVLGVTRFVQRQAAWSIYLEEAPAAKIPDLKKWGGDGIIADLDDPGIAKAVVGLKIPVVGIGNLSDDDFRRFGISIVHTDDAAVARMAAEHLLERGLIHFAYAGDATPSVDQWNHIRRDEFTRRVRERGGDCVILADSGQSVRQWRTAQKTLASQLARLHKPVGVMAANDNRARHVAEACRLAGLQIPDDVALLGVDNDTIACTLAAPPLSSVWQGTEQIGFAAAQLLDRLLRRPALRPQRISMAPIGVVARQSSDVYSVSDPLVEQALHYIRDNAGCRIGVPDVVRAVDVSRSNVAARFRRLLGRTIQAEIQRQRVNLAKDLLMTTTLPIHEIAQRAGFNNAQYMNAVFQRSLRVTPGSFRKT